MSEVQSRPSAARGRGSARGGRGGHISRGGRGGASSRSAKPTGQESLETPSYEDEGEIGLLKKKHANSLSTIRELFADWTDEDLVFALEDADGDLELAIERITEGNVSQWGEVKKKHIDRSKPKPKESQPQIAENNAPPMRAGRGRGGFEARGRGRGDRGRGARGGRVPPAQINGARSDKPPTHAPEASEAPLAAVETAPVLPSGDVNPQNPSTEETVIPATEQTAKSSLIPEGSKRGWASLFAKPAPAVVKEPPPPAVPESAPTTTTTTTTESVLDSHPTESIIPPPEVIAREQLPPAIEPQLIPVIPQAAPLTSQTEQATTAKPIVETIEPHLPLPTAIGAEKIPAQHEEQPLQPTRAPIPGYPYKAGTGSGRGPSFQRRMMEQQEAVVMPGNHAVDRAAVQFGSMGLNGSIDDADIDEEREQPETRPQPPQHSPVAPRAALPPSTRTAIVSEPAPIATRPAPGLPPAPVAHPTTSAEASFNDFARYGEAQKQYDIFNQPTEHQPQPQAQEPFSNQGAVPTQQPAVVTSAGDYSAFYGGDQARNPYYYNGYGQHQDPTATQRAAGTGFGTTGAESQPQIPASQPPNRYSQVEAQAPNSGQNTPNPTVPGQMQSAQPSHIPQSQGAHGGFNYGYPYYTNPHYPNAYMNQMGQPNYGGRNRPMYDDARRYEDHYLPHGSQFGYQNQYAPYGKGGMYNQPQQHAGYGYEHSSSPANVAGFNQTVPGRDATAYARTGSAQASEGQQQSTSATAFGGIPDVFGRTQSGFGQNQPMPSQQAGSTDDSSSAKAFETSKAGGPSPSISQANRPGSATNNAPLQPTTAQTSLPPIPAAQQGNQQAFGGYPHLNPQYSGLGGLGHQTGSSQTHHQATGYNNYGAGFGSNYYSNSGRGGGWGGNYTH
ncbi:RNAPII degradation factor [Myotisia sp. PD_48]|nr:RNAPII degradation factor [Myotisia sp. PD_48]